MRVLTETRNGPMLVLDNDEYVGRSFVSYGEFSQGEVDFFAKVLRQGMVVCDVGANIGAHTVAFARMVGKNGMVFAYEPQRILHQMLCANVALNGLDNVFTYQVAIGAEDSTVKMFRPDYEARGNFGGLSLDILSGGEETTAVMPLNVPCHFLKIDVEGMELQVLQGAADMIRSCQPLMYIENDREDKAAALINFIRELGYTPRWHLTPLFNPDNVRKNAENVWGKPLVSVNVIAVPPRAEGFEGFDEVIEPRFMTYQKEKLHGRAQSLA